eukprot:9388135-Lingulodinium_polyedra.AAC.1
MASLARSTASGFRGNDTLGKMHEICLRADAEGIDTPHEGDDARALRALNFGALGEYVDMLGNCANGA